VSDHPVALRAQRQLTTFAKGFELNPLDAVEEPEAAEWGNFLREHPQYYTADLKITALTLAGDRKILEEMEPEYQRLGGSLIRVAFTSEQIQQIADRPAYASI
jgi:hypothetical protein